MPKPSIKADILAPFPSFVRRYGVAPEPLLTSAGLDGEMLRDHDADVPLEAVCRLFESAADACRDASFGLLYGAAFPPGGAGVLGHVVLSAPTVRDALVAFARFVAIHSALGISFEESSGVGRVRTRWPPGLIAPRLQFTGALVAALVQRIRRGAGEYWRPPLITFDHRPPADAAAYYMVLGPNLRFDQPEIEVVVDATALARPMPLDIQNIHRSMLELAEQKLHAAQLPSDVVELARAAIAERLAGDRPFGLEAIAEVLAMPPRTLQWQLDQRATSYERLLGEIRRDIAERLLRETSLTLTEIARKLRFSELSAFTRAARRWFGMAPSAWRRRQTVRPDD